MNFAGYTDGLTSIFQTLDFHYFVFISYRLREDLVRVFPRRQIGKSQLPRLQLPLLIDSAHAIRIPGA
jgi:hypothetical protein